jgi:hypothetical protein
VKGSIGAGGKSHYLWICSNCNNAVYAIEDEIIYPSTRTDASPDLPPEVRENFNEALSSLNANNPKAAVLMTRSALQAATREQGATGASLAAEIDDLATNNKLPKSLQDWSHELRDGGNLAAHPEPDKRIQIQDAEELVSLAEAIFQYLYVIPPDVRRRRARLAP